MSRNYTASNTNDILTEQVSYNPTRMITYELRLDRSKLKNKKVSPIFCYAKGANLELIRNFQPLLPPLPPLPPSWMIWKILNQMFIRNSKQKLNDLK